MKTHSAALMLIAALFSLGAIDRTLAQRGWNEREVDDPLHQLHGHTAWVLLGFVDESNEWATVPVFKVIKRGDVPVIGDTNLPKLGDKIKLEVPARLVVVDFGKNKTDTGKSPASLTRLEEKDVTGFVLRRNALVHIQTVEPGKKGVSGLTPIWAKVVP